MIRKHKSSVATFFGIYLTVSLIVGAAVYGLYRSNNIERKNAVNEGIAIVSRDKLIPNPAVAPKLAKVEKKVAIPSAEKPKPKPNPVPAVKNKEPQRRKVKPPEKQSLPDSALEDEIAKMFPMPKIKPLLETVGNWRDVPKRAYPSFVTIHKPVDFKIRQGSAVVAEGKIPTGSSMIPLQLNDNMLTLSSSRNSTMTVILPVNETDFKQKIEAKYNAFVTRQEASVLASRNAEKKRRGMAEVRESKLSSYNVGKDPRFDPLKASIRRGEAGFFQIESASQFRWAGNETIESEEFETAFVMMVQESAFGSSENELKALIKDGEVVSWIDMSTGEKL